MYLEVFKYFKVSLIEKTATYDYEALTQVSMAYLTDTA